MNIFLSFLMIVMNETNIPVLCTFGFSMWILFYKYFAALPL